MKKLLLLLTLILAGTCAFSQKEWSNWYFNGRRLLTFKNDTARLDYDFAPQPPPDDLSYYIVDDPGYAYSDPKTGDLKFLVGLNLGFNRNYLPFPDDHFLRSCPGDKMAIHIIPFPNNPDKFYVIQFQDLTADLVAAESHLQVRCPNAIGLGYSVVDMTRDNGKGDWETMNQVLMNGLSGQITTVRHANGKDVWIIVHPFYSSKYAAILINGQGIQPPVYSDIGPTLSGGSLSVGGYLTANHQGNLLVASVSPVKDAILLFDFDNNSGKLSNYRTMQFKEEYSGIMQFSPDDSKLYCETNNGVWQYDFNKPDVEASATMIYRNKDGFDYLFDMQLGPDGKIYFPGIVNFENGEYKTYLGAIECPNLPQYACNFNGKALYHEYGYGQFPDLINDFIKEPKAAPVTQFSIGKDTAVCFGSYTIAAPDGWESYRWNTGETTKQITVTKAGVYYVLTGNTGFSCPEGYGYINITDKAKKLDLGKDTSLCPKTTYELSVPSSYTNIVWENGSHVRDSLITLGSNFIISANDANGCFTSDTITVSYNYYPIAGFGNDTTLCNNAPLTLQLYPEKNPFYDNHAKYAWQDGSTLDKYTVTKSGTYWGTVSFDGCSVSDTIKVSYGNANAVFLGNDTTLCSGDSLLLYSNVSNAKYIWSTGETTENIYTNTGGNYWVKVNTGQCTATDTIRIRFNNKPQFSLGADTALCQDEAFMLESPVEGNSFLWQDGSTEYNTIVQSPGWYSLAVTKDGCTGTDSIYVSYKQLPVVNLGSDTGFCTGSSVLLNAQHPNTSNYVWQDGSTQPFYKATDAGTYFVQVTGADGCIKKDTIEIFETEPPVFSLGNDTALCKGQEMAYHFNFGNAAYQWNDGNTNADYHITESGDYALTITQQGCSSTDAIRIAFKPLPHVDLGNDTTVCEGTTFLLDGNNAGASYTWQDGSIQPRFEVTHGGSYRVKVNLDGCFASDTINILYKNKPVFTLGTDFLLCKGQQATLKPNINSTSGYRWQDGSTLPQLIVKDSGLYSLTISNECGATTEEVKITEAVCMLQMPSAFSPNRDGINDIFRVKYPGYIRQFRMTIFTRWGQKIADITDPYRGWDGSLKGVPMDAGTYIWKIWLTDKDSHTQMSEGTVTLIR